MQRLEKLGHLNVTYTERLECSTEYNKIFVLTHEPRKARDF